MSQTYVKHAVNQSSRVWSAVQRSTTLTSISWHSSTSASEYFCHDSFVRPNLSNLLLVLKQVNKTGTMLELNTNRTAWKETQTNIREPCKFTDFRLIYWRSTEKDYACLLWKALLNENHSVRIYTEWIWPVQIVYHLVELELWHIALNWEQRS